MYVVRDNGIGKKEGIDFSIEINCHNYAFKFIRFFNKIFHLYTNLFTMRTKIVNQIFKSELLIFLKW